MVQLDKNKERQGCWEYGDVPMPRLEQLELLLTARRIVLKAKRRARKLRQEVERGRRANVSKALDAGQ